MALGSKKPAAAMPLVPVAIVLCLGIILGRYSPIPLGYWLLFTLAALVCSLATFLRDHLRPITAVALGVGFLSAGASLSHLGYYRVPSRHIASFLPAHASPLATLTGQVVTAPEITDDAAQKLFTSYERPAQTQFLLECTSVATPHGPAACEGLVRVRVEEATWQIQPGQELRLCGQLFRPRGPGNPGQYDRRAAARRDALLVECVVPAAEAVETITPRPSWISQVLWHLRAQARQHLQADSDRTDQLLLQALVLGDRDAALKDLSTDMTRAGVIHFLSISGENLTILLGFLYLLLRLLQVSPRTSALLVLILMAGFLLLAETQSPLLRAAIMSASLCLAAILGRRGNTGNLLAAAAVVLLVWQPMELFRPGFQLSFGILAGILLFYRPVRQLLFGRYLEQRGLMVFRDDERVRRWLWHRGSFWLANYVSVSVAAWLASMPLVAYHFGLFTPLAPLTTLLLLPLVSAAMVTGYLQLVLAWPLPTLASCLSGPLGFLCAAVSGLSEFLGRLPFISFDLYAVPVWAVVLLYAALLLAAWREGLRMSRKVALGIVLVSAVLVGVVTQKAAPPALCSQLSVLDVGHGSCAVLRCPSGRTVLFDAGTSSGFDPTEAVIRPFLREVRWPAPSAAFVSHGDSDHYNAIPGLLRYQPLSHAFINDVFGQESPHSGASVLLNEFSASGTHVQRVNRGQRVRLDGRTTVTVLWPPPAAAGFQFVGNNDSSLVLRLECDGVRAIIPGDIEELSERLLLELSPRELKADVLILPHHGSFTKVLDAFVQAVDPAIVIRSGPSYRTSGAATASTPAGQAKEDLAGLTSLLVHRQFLSTGSNGYINIDFTPSGPKAETPCEDLPRPESE